jgi:phospholipase/carboxylesterase
MSDVGSSSPTKRRVTIAVALVVAALGAYFQLRPRPRSLPLATSVDGPDPARAAGVIFFLHGRGGSLGRAERMVGALRDAGLPADVSIVLVEAPFSTGFGHKWGDTAEDQTQSRARVRSLIHDTLGEHGPPPERVAIAGFSQGAGVAADVAAEDERVGAMASFSPCAMWLRGELPKRTDLRVLLAHGSRDPICPVSESRSLAAVLETANVPVRYVEFDGEHTMPPEVVKALVGLLAVSAGR